MVSFQSCELENGFCVLKCLVGERFNKLYLKSEKEAEKKASEVYKKYKSRQGKKRNKIFFVILKNIYRIDEVYKNMVKAGYNKQTIKYEMILLERAIDNFYRQFDGYLRGGQLKNVYFLIDEAREQREIRRKYLQ